MGKHIGLAGALVGYIVLATKLALATPEHFAGRGQWVIDDRFSLYAAHSEPGQATGLDYSANAIRLSPSVAVFVLPRLSLGLGVDLQRNWTWFEKWSAHSNRYLVGVQPRVGYALPFSEHFSWWPELGVRVSRTWASFPAQSGTVRSTDVEVLARAPVLWHPVDHFFVGVGPTFSCDLGATETQPKLQPWFTSFGLGSVIGGYFGG
jgi:hypothetical protein